MAQEVAEGASKEAMGEARHVAREDAFPDDSGDGGGGDGGDDDGGGGGGGGGDDGGGDDGGVDLVVFGDDGDGDGGDDDDGGDRQGEGLQRLVLRGRGQFVRGWMSRCSGRCQALCLRRLRTKGFDLAPSRRMAPCTFLPSGRGGRGWW